MLLSDLITTISSQIPIVAVDVLSPEEATIIEWITQQVTAELKLPVYFWNLGVSTLEQALIASDGGLTFKFVDSYKKPPVADSLLFIFEYIQNTNSDGVFILGDVSVSRQRFTDFIVGSSDTCEEPLSSTQAYRQADNSFGARHPTARVFNPTHSLC